MDKNLEDKLIKRIPTVTGEIVECDFLGYAYDELGQSFVERFGEDVRKHMKKYRLIVRVGEDFREINTTTSMTYSVGDKYSVLVGQMFSN